MEWVRLQRDLRAIALLPAVELEKTRFGQKYGITGSLVGPNGKTGQVMTVWIIMEGQEFPRLVTAYPDD